jgi:hypothetical protein
MEVNHRLKYGNMFEGDKARVFDRLIKTIEVSYGISVYKAEPISKLNYKHYSIAHVGRDCIYLPELRLKLLRLVRYLENFYGIKIFKVDWCDERKKELIKEYYDGKTVEELNI